MAIGVGPALAPITWLTIGPCGERFRVMVTGSSPFTAIVSWVMVNACHWPLIRTWSGLAGLTCSAIRSTSSFWNMVRLQPNSRLCPSEAKGLSAW
ncbi:hypothetical protein D9M71_518820 [compost metagenome]